MSEFKTIRKGYSKEEVDSFLKKLKTEYENRLAEQKARIFELKNQLTEAEKKLVEYKADKELISKAILNAVKKAEDIERTAKEKYDLEISQLKAFHQKWLLYYDEIIKRYPINQELSAIDTLNQKVERVLKRDAPSQRKSAPRPERTSAEKIYDDESKRLSKQGVNLDALSSVMDNEEPEERFENFVIRIGGKRAIKKDSAKKEFDPMKNIHNYLDTQPKETTGFSYEEAQHPTDTLEEIMRDLGLLDD